MVGDIENILQNCLVFTAGSLARTLTKMAEEEFANTGLAPSYAFLITIVNSKNGAHPTEISDILGLAPSTVTRLIEKLERKKLVRKKIHGKQVEIRPTKKSKELQELINYSWQNLFSRYSDILGKDESIAFNEKVYKMAEKLKDSFND